MTKEATKKEIEQSLIFIMFLTVLALAIVGVGYLLGWGVAIVGIMAVVLWMLYASKENKKKEVKE